MASHEHELFLGIDSNQFEYTIQCRKCNNKWHIKKKYSVSVFIFLIMFALTLTILSFVFKNVLILLLAISVWSMARRPNVLLGLLFNHIDKKKLIGEQYTYDFITDRKNEQYTDGP